MLSVSTVFLAVFAASACTAHAAWLEARTNDYSASSFVGLSTSAVFPVSDAVNAASSYDSYFPDATEVGEPGPTPTGDEAELIATATALPKLENTYPLLDPTLANSTSSTNSSSDDFDVIRSWGNLSPMWSLDAGTWGLDSSSPLIPEGCELTQVHLVHRHGARYPSDSSTISDFGLKLNDAVQNGTGFTATGDLAFLNTWTDRLGAELLTPFGRQQLFNLGVAFRLRYGELLKGFTELPVFRTTSEERMVQSAQNFAAGFFGVPDFLTDYRQTIMIENWENNNTLAPACENWNLIGDGDYGDYMVDKWTALYLQDAVTRLDALIDGVNFTVTDMSAMQDACAYETVALGYSAFCQLFTEEEWKGYNYAIDLNFWYGYGPGNPTSAAQGIGYVQQLVSRLTQEPIETYNTTTNSTLDGNTITFPFGQPIYVDATHDSIITNIIIAMNFSTPADNGPLPTDHIPDNQTFFSNQIAPFASQFVGQVMTCPSSYSPDSSSSSTDSSSYIRWILNDAVLPLTRVNGCSEDADGLCPLDTFIDGMKQRLAEVDYNFDCNGNYTFDLDNDTIVDGRPPLSERPS